MFKVTANLYCGILYIMVKAGCWHCFHFKNFKTIDLIHDFRARTQATNGSFRRPGLAGRQVWRSLTTFVQAAWQVGLYGIGHMLCPSRHGAGRWCAKTRRRALRAGRPGRVSGRRDGSVLPRLSECRQRPRYRPFGARLTRMWNLMMRCDRRSIGGQRRLPAILGLPKLRDVQGSAA